MQVNTMDAYVSSLLLFNAVWLWLLHNHPHILLILSSSVLLDTFSFPITPCYSCISSVSGSSSKCSFSYASSELVSYSAPSCPSCPPWGRGGGISPGGTEEVAASTWRLLEKQSSWCLLSNSTKYWYWLTKALMYPSIPCFCKATCLDWQHNNHLRQESDLHKYQRHENQQGFISHSKQVHWT